MDMGIGGDIYFQTGVLGRSLAGAFEHRPGGPRGPGGQGVPVEDPNSMNLYEV